MWTIARIDDVYSQLPVIENEDEWARSYVYPIEEFGYSIDRTPAITASSEWDFSNQEAVLVPLDKITTSYQVEGIRLDALHWYLHNDRLFDFEGWYNNDRPVLLERSEGTYTILDGNHRIISTRLRGCKDVLAYVVR